MKGENSMESRVAVLAILVENRESAEKINGILHEFNSFIIGRMGLPYRERNVNIISIMLDAPADKINTLAGKLGRLEGVTAKAVYAGMK
jgi:putative iron-only hydrogenase system regulator